MEVCILTPLWLVRGPLHAIAARRRDSQKLRALSWACSGPCSLKSRAAGVAAEAQAALASLHPRWFIKWQCEHWLSPAAVSSARSARVLARQRSYCLAPSTGPDFRHTPLQGGAFGLQLLLRAPLLHALTRTLATLTASERRRRDDPRIQWRGRRSGAAF